MKCQSIDRSIPKRYRVVCKCKYFALNTLSGTKPQGFNPLKDVRRASPPFLYGSPSPGVIGHVNERNRALSPDSSSSYKTPNYTGKLDFSGRCLAIQF